MFWAGRNVLWEESEVENGPWRHSTAPHSHSFSWARLAGDQATKDGDVWSIFRRKVWSVGAGWGGRRSWAGLWLQVKAQPHSLGSSGPQNVSSLEATPGAGSRETMQLPEPQISAPEGNHLEKAAVAEQCVHETWTSKSDHRGSGQEINGLLMYRISDIKCVAFLK